MAIATKTVITEYDITYRLNKLKCCFATKAADLVDKQRYGKECKDELCNLKLLGAYIEIVECYSALPCNCQSEWELDGSIIWNTTITIPYGTVVKVLPRSTSVPGEFLYMRWQGISTLIPPAGICFDPISGWTTPCFTGAQGIGPASWSVCGNIKQAWEARGLGNWDGTFVYNYGDIVKFMGGGIGVDQSKRGNYFICITSPAAAGIGFHESGNWIELKCYPKQEV